MSVKMKRECNKDERNWLFCLKIESSFCRKDTVLTIRGSNILCEALAIIPIHLRDVNKQPRSDGYLSL